MASSSLWYTDQNSCAIGNDLSANNLSGFTGLPGGMRYYVNWGTYESSYFSDIEYQALWWTATEYTSSHSYIIRLDFNSPWVDTGWAVEKYQGFAVRCLKD